jgi:hypothetical protein
VLTLPELELWLTRVLQAWRDHAVPTAPVEPWDWYYAGGAADRALASHLLRKAMIAIAQRSFRDLGADPERLGVELDLAPRRGKDPVAYTDFLRRGRYDGGAWRDGGSGFGLVRNRRTRQPLRLITSSVTRPTSPPSASAPPSTTGRTATC